MLQKFHGSYVINSQNVERSQMPTDRRTDKQIVMYWHKGTPPSHKKEQAMATWEKIAPLSRKGGRVSSINKVSYPAATWF